MFNDCDYCREEKGLAIPLWMHFDREKLIHKYPDIDTDKFIGPKCFNQFILGVREPEKKDG